jgi:spoIIIJ-associated protein
MEKYLDTTGKTIEQALETALEQLGLDRDGVSLEILDKPRSGFLGLGGNPARIRVHYKVEPVDKVREFLEGLLERMNVEADISIDNSNPDICAINISGENVGSLIGRRGETMDSLQYLTSLAINRGQEDYKKIILDIENYRAKRVAALEKLAKKLAGMVLRNRKNMTLEAMNAAERRIIHATLQDYAGVTTFSTGSEPNRRVVIAIERKRADGSSPRPSGASRRPGV